MLIRFVLTYCSDMFVCTTCPSPGMDCRKGVSPYRDVCQAIRTVLATGAPPIVTFSQRAQIALRGLAEELPMSLGTHFVVARSDAAPVRTWTFAGARANRTRAHQASVGGQKVRFDALSAYAPASRMTDAAQGQLPLTDVEITSFAESVKFAECVPQRLLTRTVVARNFETPLRWEPAPRVQV